MTRPVTRNLPFLGGAGLVLAGLVPWAGGLTNPLADESDNLGRSLLPLGTPLANTWCVLVGLIILAAGVASLGRPGTDPTIARRTTIAGAVLGLLTLDHTALMVLGYLPMILGLTVTGHADRFEILLSPGLLVQVLTAAAALTLALTVLRGWRPATASRQDALDEAGRRTRRWTMIAIEAPLVYALSRILMFLQVPGFRGFEATVLWFGLGLGAASICGAWLTWGLVRPWGERFPRWMLGLSGRRVPIGCAVVPALVIAALIGTASRGILVGLVTADRGWKELLDAPLIAFPQLLWPLWAVALALAALNYGERRRLGELPANGADEISVIRESELREYTP